MMMRHQCHPKVTHKRVGDPIDLTQIKHARTLDEVEDSEVALLLVHRKDEVERGVVPVDEFHAFPPLRDAAHAYACVVVYERTSYDGDE
jgi:hypothetical protein